MRRAFSLCTLALLLWVSAATAAVPQTISYQGLLRDSGGTIVADGNYNLSFRIYSVASGGSALWTETQTLAVQDGVFNALLGSVTALTLDFNTPYWLGVTVAADPELTPRIALAAAPYSLNADRLDGLSSGDFAASAHAHTLDSLSDVSVPAPTSGQVLTFNGANWDAQTPVAGGDDWDNAGGNIYRPTGKVGLGAVPLKPAPADERAAERLGRDASLSKLQIYADTANEEGGIYAQLYDTDNNSDARAAVYGLRVSGLSNPGTGFGPVGTNNAITGYNTWGDSYSFGVAGYSYFDSPNTAGVLGANQLGDYWAALGYRDGVGSGWGLYTPFNAYFGSQVGIGTELPDRSLAVNNPAGSAIIGEVTYVGLADYIGVEGRSVPADFYGIGGKFRGGYVGVVGEVFSSGEGNGYTGVSGFAAGSGTKYGVYGYSFGSGTNYGVYGYGAGGTTNYAGYFEGNVQVTGTLSKAAGSFKIDHPLDPANKTLSHSFVESPDMMNVYNGNAVLDASGTAWVEMPEWFEALNRDFRYQLTCIGGFAPVYVGAEMMGNRFQIAGGQGGMKVSWMVTGIRQDAYANAHRIPVEETKMDKESGRYLHPELFGQPESEGIGYRLPQGEK